MDLIEHEVSEGNDPLWMSSKPDDDELSVAIAERWCNSLRYLHSEWHIYERGCWNACEPETVRKTLRNFLRELRKELPHLELQISNPRINGLMSFLQSDLFITSKEFNAMLPYQEQYINLQNGLYNLETFSLEPHQADLKFTTQLDFAYDPKAECPNWERYLRTSLVDEQGRPDIELMFLVQEAMAYSMTARTDMKASFWCVGEPNSGKSTLIALIRSLMGSLHATIDLNQLATNRFLLSGIIGKRVVTFTEASESAVLPDALYKAMVGGSDEIYADVKNRPGISFKPIAKFWWAMNGAPRITDRSGATLNRLKIIPFIRSVPAELRVSNLDYLLMRERSGIFNWLIAGYQRLLKEGAFTEPEQSEAWRENYRIENDTEGIFLVECCTPDPEGKIKGEQLYAQYAAWCQRNGNKTKNSAQAAKEWVRLGMRRTRVNGSSVWHGYRLNEIHLNLR